MTIVSDAWARNVTFFGRHLSTYLLLLLSLRWNHYKLQLCHFHSVRKERSLLSELSIAETVQALYFLYFFEDILHIIKRSQRHTQMTHNTIRRRQMEMEIRNRI